MKDKSFKQCFVGYLPLRVKFLLRKTAHNFKERKFSLRENHDYKMAHIIDQKKCICCATCEVECPFHAVVISSEGKFSIDKEACKNCGKCAAACPMDAITKE